MLIGLAYGVKTNDHMLSRFHLIPERYGRTDRQICYISFALMRDQKVESESANLLIFKRTAQQFCHLANENMLQPITF